MSYRNYSFYEAQMGAENMPTLPQYYSYTTDSFIQQCSLLLKLTITK